MMVKKRWNLNLEGILWRFRVMKGPVSNAYYGAFLIREREINTTITLDKQQKFK
jgi:hypothetical protein